MSDPHGKAVVRRSTHPCTPQVVPVLASSLRITFNARKCKALRHRLHLLHASRAIDSVGLELVSDRSVPYVKHVFTDGVMRVTASPARHPLSASLSERPAPISPEDGVMQRWGGRYV